MHRHTRRNVNRQRCPHTFMHANQEACTWKPVHMDKHKNHMHTFACTCSIICTHGNAGMCSHSRGCLHAQLHAHIHTHTPPQAQVCTHAHAHTCSHAHSALPRQPSTWSPASAQLSPLHPPQAAAPSPAPCPTLMPGVPRCPTTPLTLLH